MTRISIATKLPKTRRGQLTREKLLNAAEAEFGEKGFHEAAISGITQRAGVAMGTFYTYFESKEAIFRDLVSYMGHLTRKWISERVAEASDRVTAEHRGVQAFIEFVRQHTNLYQIVCEAQFVAEDAFRDYYQVFADAYRDNLQHAGVRGEIRQGDYEVWSWALIGVNVFLGMRFAAWGDTKTSNEVADAAADFIANGIAKSE